MAWKAFWGDLLFVCLVLIFRTNEITLLNVILKCQVSFRNFTLDPSFMYLNEMT